MGVFPELFFRFDPLDPVVMESGEPLNRVGMLFREIVSLGNILRKVHQEGGVVTAEILAVGIASVHDQFPVPLADGPLLSGLPMEDLVRRGDNPPT